MAWLVRYKSAQVDGPKEVCFDQNHSIDRGALEKPGGNIEQTEWSNNFGHT